MGGRERRREQEAKRPSAARWQLDAWLQRWLQSYQPSLETLACARVIYALFVLFLLEPGLGFATVSHLPDGLFLPPPGPARWVAAAVGLSGFPSEQAFAVLHYSLCCCLGALAVGFRTLWASLATGLLLCVGCGLMYSAGKVNHNFLLCAMPLALAGSGWGATLSVDALLGRPTKARPWLLGILAVLVGFSMFTAGVQKVGWLVPSSVASRGHLLRHVSFYGRTDLLALPALALSTPWVWKILDVCVVAFEVSFLPAAFSARRFRLWVALALVFHTGVFLVLNISFSTNYPVYAAFVPWAGLLVRSAPRLGKSHPAADSVRPRRRYAGLLLVGGLASALGAARFGSPLRLLDGSLSFASDATERDVLALSLAWLTLLALVARGGFLAPRRAR